VVVHRVNESGVFVEDISRLQSQVTPTVQRMHLAMCCRRCRFP